MKVVLLIVAVAVLLAWPAGCKSKSSSAQGEGRRSEGGLPSLFQLLRNVML